MNFDEKLILDGQKIVDKLIARVSRDAEIISKLEVMVEMLQEELKKYKSENKEE